MRARILLLTALTSILQAISATSCDCYATSTEEYYLNHQFHDFRSIDSIESIPALPSGLPTDLVPTQSDYDNDPSLGVEQAGWIQSNEWTDSWAIMNWGKEPTGDFPVRMQNSLANVYVAHDALDVNATSKLVFRTHRFSDFHSSAEAENQQKNLLYASIRIRARVYGASGAVAGLFIFQNNANESDIEILTRDTKNEIRYSNQPVVDGSGNEIVGASTSVNMATGAQLDGSEDPDALRKRDTEYGDVRWDAWHTYRIDWVEGRNSWFVDGEHYLDKTYGVPTVPSYFVMNMWSDGGVWSGNMTVGDSAFLDVAWVEMAFNTSGPITGYPGSSTKVKRGKKDECKNVCVVDDVDVVGTPQERAAAGRMVVQYGMLVVGLVVAVMMM